VDGSTVTDTDVSHYFGSEPSIEVEKLTNGMDVTAPRVRRCRSGTR
jgi:hypothetical protein